MRQIRTEKLNLEQREEIEQLVNACRAHDRSCLSFAFDGDSVFFLLYGEETLLCALSLSFTEQELCECGAFTLPSARNRGYFSRLFQAALEELDRYETQHSLDVELYFSADPRCRDTAAVLKSLEAEYWYSEFMMELNFSDFSPDSGTEAHAVRIEETSGGGFLFYSLRPSAGSAELLGSCSLDIHGPTAYFYGFRIEEPLRGRGLGYACLCRLLSHLAGRGVQTVRLQVSEHNAPALALYKKTGFRISETLSYYWY